jgi:hypothetical protein
LYNDNVTFTIQSPVAGTTYNWYATSTSTNILFTGTAYTINNVIGNEEFYIEAVASTGCISATRKRVKIHLLALLNAPTVTVTTKQLHLSPLVGLQLLELQLIKYR